jgi:hypothetical protein
LNQEGAVLRIQTAYRGYLARKNYGPLINSKTGKIDGETAKFIEPFASKWKNKSIFQVLLQYRSFRFRDFVNFSQQVRFSFFPLGTPLIPNSLPLVVGGSAGSIFMIQWLLNSHTINKILASNFDCF